MLRTLIDLRQLQTMGHLARTAPPGAFVEVGVYEGGSAQHLYDVALSQGRELHLFDTFAGIPCRDDRLDECAIGDFCAGPEALQNIRDAMPRAWVHVGTYPSTHPCELTNVAFVHCDCDQYASYRAVIDNLWPIMVEGGMMLFDDYPYLPGAKQAVEETFSRDELKSCYCRYYAVK